MNQTVLVAVGLMALLAVASAQSIWPAGTPGEDIEFKLEARAELMRGKKWHSKDNDYQDHKDNKTADKDLYYYGRDKWDDGKGDKNTPHEHVHEHGGPCLASRVVTASPTGNRPLNPQCPPPPNPQNEDCVVPFLCPSNSVDPLCPPDEFKRYDANGVEQHFRNQPGFDMVDVKHHTYSCVDARGDEPMLGTPGGDLSELMNAAMALMKISGSAYSRKIADEVFDVFTSRVATPDRPLYFHTDDASLRSMFTYLRRKLPAGTPVPVILPWRGPAGTEGDIWIEALTRPEFNGCGHIRLQMDPERAAYYSVNLDTEAPTIANCVGKEKNAGDCIDSIALAKRIVANFFNYWWFSPSGALQRHKVAFAVEGILIGPLLGKAVTIIKNKPAAACTDYAPVVRPTFGGSKVFAYHPDAVANWRAYVAGNALSDLVGKYADGNTELFINTWNNIAGMQLGATLTWLRPANSIGIFQVDVPVLNTETGEGDVDEPKGGYEHEHQDEQDKKY